MVIKAMWEIRNFVLFMFFLSLGFAAALSLLLFDVHTVNHDNDGGFPTYDSSSSMFALRNTTYFGTAIGPTDMTFAFGDLWRSLHSVLDISWYGNKGDAELAGVLEVYSARIFVNVLQLLIQVVILNLLIAVLNDAYDKTKDGSVLEASYQKAQLVMRHEM